MSAHLTTGQRALLRTELEQRQRQLDRRVAEHHGGLSRAEHAREVLQQDGDDAPQRESERELGEVSQAIKRMDAGEYGLCGDCGTEIPYDRLRAEPWALRCVVCEGKHELAAARRG